MSTKMTDINLGTRQLYSFNRDFRNCLFKHVSTFMHAYGRNQMHKDALPRLNLNALNYVLGIFPSLKFSDLEKRVEANNVECKHLHYLTEQAIASGMQYLPDRYRKMAPLMGVKKSASRSLLTLSIKFDSRSLVTTEMLEEFLNECCLNMYIIGMFSDSSCISEVMDVASEYITDLLWFSTEPHSSLKMEASSKHLENLTPGIASESLTVRPKDSPTQLIDPDSCDHFQDRYNFKDTVESQRNRWYCKPLTELYLWLKAMISASSTSSKSHNILGNELFPIEFRVGYAGDWETNVFNGENKLPPLDDEREYVLSSFNNFSTHNMHPLRTAVSNCDLSIPQRVGKLAWSNSTVTRSRASQGQMYCYDKSRELLKMISLNYHRIHRIQATYQMGLKVVMKINYDSPDLRQFFQTAWMSLRASPDPEVRSSDFLYIYHEYCKTKSSDLATRLKRFMVEKEGEFRARCKEITLKLEPFYSEIYNQLQYVASSLLSKRFDGLYDLMAKKSRYCMDSLFIRKVEALLLHQLDELFTLTQQFFQPSLDREVRSTLIKLRKELDYAEDSPLNRLSFPSYKFLEFMRMSTAEIAALSEGYFSRIKIDWSQANFAEAFRRCLVLRQAKAAKIFSALIADSETIKFVLSGFLKYSNLLANQKQLDIADMVEADDSITPVYEALLSMISFCHTPLVTSSLIKKQLNAIERIVDGKVQTIDQLPTMFELTNSVWATVESWDFIDNEHGTRQIIELMSPFEFMLFCVESVAQVHPKTDPFYRRRLRVRLYYNLDQVMETGCQPAVFFVHHNGNISTIPEEASKKVDLMGYSSGTESESGQGIVDVDVELTGEVGKVKDETDENEPQTVRVGSGEPGDVVVEGIVMDLTDYSSDEDIIRVDVGAHMDVPPQPGAERRMVEEARSLPPQEGIKHSPKRRRKIKIHQNPPNVAKTLTHSSASGDSFQRQIPKLRLSSLSGESDDPFPWIRTIPRKRAKKTRLTSADIPGVFSSKYRMSSSGDASAEGSTESSVGTSSETRSGTPAGSVEGTRHHESTTLQSIARESSPVEMRPETPVRSKRESVSVFDEDVNMEPKHKRYKSSDSQRTSNFSYEKTQSETETSITPSQSDGETTRTASEGAYTESETELSRREMLMNMEDFQSSPSKGGRRGRLNTVQTDYAELMFAIIYPEYMDSDLQSNLASLSGICSDRDSEDFFMFKAVLLSKVIMRRFSEDMDIDDQLVDQVISAVGMVATLQESKMWLWQAVVINIYRMIMLRTSLFLDRVHKLCDAFKDSPKCSIVIQVISLMQLLVFKRIFSVGAIVDPSYIDAVINLECNIYGSSGAIYRFLDFLRCYIKPTTLYEKILTVKVFKILMKKKQDMIRCLSEEIHGYRYDDMGRNVLHHVADLGLDENVTLEMMRTNLLLVDDNVDALGRKVTSIIADLTMSYKECLKVAN